jgi:hypothetical protein
MVSASVFLAFHFVLFLIYLWRDISVMRGYELHTVLHNIGMCTILKIRIQRVHKSTFGLHDSNCPLVLCYTWVTTHYLLCSSSSHVFLLHISCLLEGRGSFRSSIGASFWQQITPQHTWMGSHTFIAKHDAKDDQVFWYTMLDSGIPDQLQKDCWKFSHSANHNGYAKAHITCTSGDWIRS